MLVGVEAEGAFQGRRRRKCAGGEEADLGTIARRQAPRDRPRIGADAGPLREEGPAVDGDLHGRQSTPGRY